MIRNSLLALAGVLALASCGPTETAAAPEAPVAVDLSVKPEERTALDEYVAKADPAYKWELIGTYPGDGQTTYVLEMTSQTWLTAAEVDRPEWTHYLTVIRPEVVERAKAKLAAGEVGNDAYRLADRMIDSLMSR